MSDRIRQGVKTPPATQEEREKFLRERRKMMRHRTPAEIAEQAWQMASLFKGEFNLRDEANAIVGIAFRNGPLENLHAGEPSPWLEDDTLRRITDDEMKAIMTNASQMVAFLLWLRDNAREFYDDYLQRFGVASCGQWERGE